MSESTHHRRSAWPLVVGFAVLAALIAATAYTVWRLQAQSIQRQAERTLTSVAGLKAGQITSWLDERRGDAEILRADPLVATAAAERLAGPRSAQAGADLQALLGAFRRTYDYVEVVMTTSGGAVLQHAPQTAPASLGPATKALVAKALATGSVQVSDVYLDTGGRAHIDFVAPILNRHGGGPAIAAVTLRADPAGFLYPLIQAWPVPSKSGETLLVERHGDEVLYLNNLRFRRHTALRLTTPVGASQRPAAMAVSGRRGVVQGIDYRGVPVLAALLPVPGTSWFIVAKEDTNDILGPVRTRGWMTAAVALVLVALAGLGTLFLWRLRESQVSAEIRASEARYRTVVEHIPQSIFLKDDQYRWVSVNQNFADDLGLSPEDVVGRTDYDLFPKELADKYREDDRRVMATGQTEEVEERTVLQDRDSWVNTVKTPVTDKSGAIVGLLGVFWDITERKQAEAALRENEERLRFLIDQTPTVNWTLDRDLRFTLSRGRGLQALGLRPDQVLGVYVGEYLGGSGPQADLGVAMHKRALAGDSFIYEQPLGDLTFDIIVGPLRNAEREIVGVIGVGYNATARRQADEARREAEGQVRRLNVELEQRVVDRTAQLDAANKELEAFAYSVSHDLRAPLRHISGFSALLAECAGDRLDEKGHHYLDTISRSVREMGTLIDDLLQFSRTGRAELRIARVDMNEVLAEALDPLRAESADRAIEWSVGALPQVVGDHSLLRQVWANLLSNSVKYTRGRAPAHIEVGARDGDGSREDVFWVRDDGVGFDMRYAHKLFGVFQRLHDSSEFEGTGIGLANVQRIVNRLGGRAWAEGEVDRGATFYFSLPRRKETPT